MSKICSSRRQTMRLWEKGVGSCQQPKALLHQRSDIVPSDIKLKGSRCFLAFNIHEGTVDMISAEFSPLRELGNAHVGMNLQRSW